MKFQSSILLIIIALVTASFALREAKQPNSLSALPLPPTTNLTALYNFSNVDTIQYSTGLSSHLAVIKDGNSFVFLDAHGVSPNSQGWVYSGGYQLRKIELVNGKWVQTKGETVATKFNSEHEPGFSKFMKTDDGYMAYSAESIVLFGNDLQSKKTLHSGLRTFVSAAIIKGTTEIAIVSLSNSTRDVSINIYDYSKDEWLVDFKILLGSQNNNMILPSANNLIQMSDGNLFITLKTHRDCQNQIFGKLDYAKIKSGAATKEFIIWQKKYPVEMMDMSLSVTGKMSAIMQIYNEEGRTQFLESVTANANVATADEFQASMQTKKTLGADQVLENDHFANMLPNGEIIAAGIGLYNYGMQHSPVFVRYDANMKVLGQYRIPTSHDAKILERGRRGKKPFTIDQNQHSRIFSKDDVSIFGLPYENTSTIKTDQELFIETYMGDMAAYQFLPGATRDEMYIMTTNALLKVNFTKYTPCTVRWETRAEADIRYASYNDDDYEEPTPTSTTTTTKPTTNSTASTPAKVTTITIKNDLTTDQNTKYGWVKIVFDGGSRATTTIQKGHTLVIDCEDVKGVYVGNLQNTSPGKLLFKTAGNCGKTMNLSNYW